MIKCVGKMCWCLFSFCLEWRSPLQRGEFFFFEDLHHALLEGLAHEDLQLQLHEQNTRRTRGEHEQHSAVLGQSEFNIVKVS